MLAVCTYKPLQMRYWNESLTEIEFENEIWIKLTVKLKPKINGCIYAEVFKFDANGLVGELN